MRMFLLTVLLGLVASTAALGQGPVGKGVVVITKTNGQAIRGRVIRELARGFLVRLEAGETVVVDFRDVANLEDAQPGRAPLPSAAKPVPAPPPAAAPAPAPRAAPLPAENEGYVAPADSSGCFPPCRAGFSCRGEVCVSARPGPAPSAGCVPSCRRGYQCQGVTCMRVCDPPCQSGQVCAASGTCTDAER
jgi:hypothetical protein